LDDLAGQRADVGTAVAPDLGLIAHAAEAQAVELAAHRGRDRAPEARLADPELTMRGHWALETIFLHQGTFTLALDHYYKALALYDPKRHRDDAFTYAQNPGVAMRCFAA